MFIGGQGLHLFLVKIPSIKKRASAVSRPFVWSDWWSCDWNIIIATQIIGGMSIIGLDELVNWKPEILEYVRWFFAGIGAFGSTVAMAKFSSYEKTLTNLIDVKASVSDALTGGTTTVQDTINKGSEATGTDIQLTAKK